MNFLRKQFDLLEQVSHHPPALATNTEGQGWTLYQEFTMGSKFRGQYLSVTPLGKRKTSSVLYFDSPFQVIVI